MNNEDSVVIEITYENTTPEQLGFDLEKFIKSVLKRRNINGWELSLVFCDDLFIKGLNLKYRKIDNPTDILSFSQGDLFVPDTSGLSNLFVAGDIIISLETAAKNAADDHIPFEMEIKRLLIHGILHLEGMDHTEENNEMIQLQEEILCQTLEEIN